MIFLYALTKEFQSFAQVLFAHYQIDTIISDSRNGLNYVEVYAYDEFTNMCI